MLLGVAALTLVALAGLVDLRTGEVRLRIDPSAEGLMPGEGPERAFYERVERLFGSGESIVVGLGAEDVFAPAVLDRVTRLTRRLEQIDGVESVLSLATAETVRARDDDILVEPLLDRLPESPEERERIRREALENPLFAGRLVARDSRATALVVSLERMSDREMLERRVDANVTAAARAEAPEGSEISVWVAGGPHQKAFTSRQLSAELGSMLPAILGLVALVLAVSLRSVRGVLLPLLGIVLGLIWTLGALAWLGRELNLVTASVPALILTVGFTYALHVVSEYYAEARPDMAPRDAVRATLSAVAVPVVVTGVTTAAGFVSLTLSPVPAVRQFGSYSLLGVATTMLASLTAVPALLALLPTPRRARAEARADGWLDRVAARLAVLALDRRRAVIAVSGLVLAMALVGASQIRVAIKFPGNMHPEHPVRSDWEAINERLGGATPLRVVIESEERDGVIEPESLAAIRALQEWLADQPDVGETVSIVDYLMILNRVLHQDDPEWFRVPGTQRLASQLLLFGGSPESRRLIDNPRRTTSVLVNATVGDSDRITALVDRIQAHMETLLPGDLRGRVTGGGALLYKVQDDVSRGQLVSITAAFVFIYLILVLMFTSFRVGLLALFPNVLPIAVYFGALGFTGVTMNPSTSLVGSLALGIAVDDTIHYFARFNSEARRLADERRGARAALGALIRPVTFTTLGLCLGFLVLTTSELGSQRQFGALAAFTIAVAWLVDVTLSPALCANVRIVTLWDVLRLDLGPEPHREIPLFHGLSLRQTRIFALMSDIRRPKAGERLMREGEAGDDLYLVIHGELAASVERQGERIELSRMGRGAVVGEVAYFGGHRTADVDVLTDALLIRFDSEDLDRLRRRYPRTAALVYRNLNYVQAERLERTTRRVR